MQTFSITLRGSDADSRILRFATQRKWFVKTI